MGVPEEKQRLCAVEDCASEGKPHTCIYDDRHHHHGCVHYNCKAAEETKHGLVFRKGWGWLCSGHYKTLILAALEYEKGLSGDDRWYSKYADLVKGLVE